jgi:Flp pilus assembly protein TadG
MQSFTQICSRLRQAGARLRDDSRGIAAVEFAVIVPLMLVMFFATVELCAAIAVDRKVTLVARTLSDLTSQSTKVKEDDLKNFFTASYGVMTPYPVTPIEATITEIHVDASKVAKVTWSKSATIAMSSGSPVITVVASAYKAGDVVSVPTQLTDPDKYLIKSDVKYPYEPAVTSMLGKVTLSDKIYTRPRHSSYVSYCTSSNACVN